MEARSTESQLLPDRELHNLSRFVKAAMGTEKNAPIAFGANQAVIVRNGRAKADLPTEFRDCLVLTVEESKGLEFNDVLVFNFFADSGASINDWAGVDWWLLRLRHCCRRGSRARLSCRCTSDGRVSPHQSRSLSADRATAKLASTPALRPRCRFRRVHT